MDNNNIEKLFGLTSFFEFLELEKKYDFIRKKNGFLSITYEIFYIDNVCIN